MKNSIISNILLTLFIHKPREQLREQLKLIYNDQ